MVCHWFKWQYQWYGLSLLYFRLLYYSLWHNGIDMDGLCNAITVCLTVCLSKTPGLSRRVSLFTRMHWISSCDYTEIACSWTCKRYAGSIWAVSLWISAGSPQRRQWHQPYWLSNYTSQDQCMHHSPFPSPPAARHPLFLAALSSSRLLVFLLLTAAVYCFSLLPTAFCWYLLWSYQTEFSA